MNMCWAAAATDCIAPSWRLSCRSQLERQQIACDLSLVATDRLGWHCAVSLIEAVRPYMTTADQLATTEWPHTQCPLRPTSRCSSAHRPVRSVYHQLLMPLRPPLSCQMLHRGCVRKTSSKNVFHCMFCWHANPLFRTNGYAIWKRTPIEETIKQLTHEELNSLKFIFVSHLSSTSYNMFSFILFCLLENLWYLKVKYITFYSKKEWTPLRFFFVKKDGVDISC